ncbi:MAG: HD domain-containing protein, partial [Ruminococcaceae bacterium]|nr:HD domain-containing protein [Oscillospiraceae bacterium]
MEFDITLPMPVARALSILEACGYEAYVVGGCVRDSLLGRTPNDWDITTNATPTEMKACFSDFRVIETGIQHGTLTVIIDGMQLEITTYRNDGEYLDNRHPVQVTFSKHIEDDLSRRDFTVNAMAYHPTKGLVDLFGGREDLQNRVVRAVGDAKTRFEEDGLRILRAIRFASVLDFDIAKDTAKAVHSCRNLLSGIAAERIREEFCKLICGRGAVRILRDYIEVISVFMPELHRCVGFEQNTKYHCFDVFEHTLQALALCEDDDLITRLGILLHDIGKPLCYTEDGQGGHFKGHAPIGVEITREILLRLRFDNETIHRMERLVEWHDIPLSAEKKRVKRLLQKL